MAPVNCNFTLLNNRKSENQIRYDGKFDVLNQIVYEKN